MVSFYVQSVPMIFSFLFSLSQFYDFFHLAFSSQFSLAQIILLCSHRCFVAFRFVSFRCLICNNMNAHNINSPLSLSCVALALDLPKEPIVFGHYVCLHLINFRHLEITRTGNCNKDIQTRSLWPCFVD